MNLDPTKAFCGRVVHLTQALVLLAAECGFEKVMVLVPLSKGLKPIIALRDVKFASGIKNINFVFYPYTDVC